MDDMDEFEQFKAMAFNQNRRGSQSVPCTPQIPAKQPFRFTRETSKSERRRRSGKRPHNGISQNKSAMLNDNDMRMCNSISGDVDLTDRLSRLSMTEIWVRRLRMRRNSSSEQDDHSLSPDANTLYPAAYRHPDNGHFYHEPVAVRRSNPEHTMSKSHNFGINDHRRSLSCRDRTRTRRPREIEREAMIRPRTSSMPSKGNGVRRPNTLPVNKQNDLSPKENSIEYYLVRTFSTSKKGLINRGDSFKRRKTPISTTENDSLVLSNASSLCSVHSATSAPPVYSVFMIGAHDVGKTSLLQQFTSSDYMANMHLDSCADTDDDDMRESKMVSVLLDEEESSLYFITALNLREKVSLTIPDAYVVVYSVSDRDTLDHAVDILQELNRGESSLAAIILVANKGDMVRSRVVEEQEGKEIAVHFNCKYIEVSAIMNLRVDELLAGTVKQIRLTEKRFRIRHSKKRKHIRAISNRDGNGCIEYAARGIVGRLFKKASPVFRSCDNLLVL